MTREQLATLLARAIDARLVEVFTGAVGRVVAYDSATGRADVQPIVRAEYRTEEGERATEDFPVIPDVPVMFPGSGGTRIKFPVSVGDEVWLSFAHVSHDKWKSGFGGSGPSRTIDPEDPRHHALSDVIAYPNAQATAVDAQLTIEFTAGGLGTGGEVRVGGTNALTLASALSAFMTALQTAITASGDTGPGSLAALQLALDNISWADEHASVVTKGM